MLDTERHKDGHKIGYWTKVMSDNTCLCGGYSSTGASWQDTDTVGGMCSASLLHMLILFFLGSIVCLGASYNGNLKHPVRGSEGTRKELIKILTGAAGITGALAIPKARALSSPFLTGVDDTGFKRLADRALSADSSFLDTGVLWKDVYYPAYFSGEWACASTTKSVSGGKSLSARRAS